VGSVWSAVWHDTPVSLRSSLDGAAATTVTEA
jgi:hypothetical protein